jgi:hypothetical protein
MEYLSYMHWSLSEDPIQTEEVDESSIPENQTSDWDDSLEEDCEPGIEGDRTLQMYPTLYF